MLEFSLFIFWFSLLLFNFIINKDIFSPSKFYSYFLFIYFCSIYVIEQNEYVSPIYVIYILFGFILSIIEVKIIEKYKKNVFIKSFYLLNEFKILTFLWFISIFPILCQVYLFYHFGGIINYFIALELRVEKWKGLGPLIFLIKVMPIINIVYLLLGLIFKLKNNKIWWMSYFFHSLFVILLGLLSGSRSNTLMIFVVLLILYSYFHKRIRLYKVFILSSILIFIAVVLGNVRNQADYSINSIDEIKLLDNNKEFKFAIGNYGLTQLNGIFEKEFTDYQYGLTFFTTITNFVPRIIWEDKPESGGVIITKHIKGNDYNPYSHYSTGLLTESIINFGYIGGFLCFVILIFLFSFLSLSIYKNFIKNLSNNNSPVKIIYLAYINMLFFMIPGKLLYSEFTNITFDLIFKYIIFMCIFIILNKNLRYKEI